MARTKKQRARMAKRKGPTRRTVEMRESRARVRAGLDETSFGGADLAFAAIVGAAAGLARRRSMQRIAMHVDTNPVAGRSGRIVESDDGFACTRCQGPGSVDVERRHGNAFVARCLGCGAERQIIDAESNDPHGEEN